MITKSILQSPTTHDLEDSVRFYERLGFARLPSDNGTLFSDGKVIVGLNSARTARTTIRLFGDWTRELAELEKSTTVILNDGIALVADPSGARVQLEPECSFEVNGQPTSVLGNFGGLSLETVDFDRTIQFWDTLGYSPSMGSKDQGWMALEREGMFSISVMKAGACPHLFFSPGLNYFNSGKNLENIKAIREAGIPIIEEITCFNSEGIADNVVLRDPGGTGFFIFND